jgi:hypothetical protein
MNEPGINSFDEFLLLYLAVTVVVGAVWVILEAHVLLGPTGTAPDRRRRQRPVLHALTVLGVLHPACSVIAWDAARVEDGTAAVDATDAARMRRRARATTAVGLVALALLCAPHVPVLGGLPGVGAVGGAIPWETP